MSLAYAAFSLVFASPSSEWHDHSFTSNTNLISPGYQIMKVEIVVSMLDLIQ